MGNTFPFTYSSQLSKRFIGLDKLLEDVNSLINTNDSYPPYNLLSNESRDSFTIEMAVAGFKREDLHVTMDDRTLIIEGTSSRKSTEDVVELHKGISGKQFKRKFSLVEHLEVENVKYEDGILTIQLQLQIPEEKQPKQFDIE